MLRTLGVSATILGLCACGSEPSPPTPGVTFSGVVNHDGAPLPGTSVKVHVTDRVGRDVGEETAVSDADGHFEARIETDTILTDGWWNAVVVPPLGSGIGRAEAWDSIGFDPGGRADTSLTFALIRVEPPAPTGTPQPLDPARLLRRYDGFTIPPSPDNVSGAFLTLEFNSFTPGEPLGRFDLSYTATTACGYGAGDILGKLTADTLYLQLRVDPFDPEQADTLVQEFEVVSFDPANDTLIVRFAPNGSGDCRLTAPAPLRVVDLGIPPSGSARLRPPRAHED